MILLGFSFRRWEGKGGKGGGGEKEGRGEISFSDFVVGFFGRGGGRTKKKKEKRNEKLLKEKRKKKNEK